MKSLENKSNGAIFQMLQKLTQPAYVAPFGPYLLNGISKWPETCAKWNITS